MSRTPGNDRRYKPAANIVPIQEIVDEMNPDEGAVVVMRDGSFRQILRAGTVNFEMKSPTEREGIMQAFGELVDSLSPNNPIQIVSHAKQLDTEAYVQQFAASLANERTPAAVRGYAKAHIEHYEQSVKARNLLQREIYVVINYRESGGPVTESMSTYMPFGRLFAELPKVLSKKAATNVTVTDKQIAVARRELLLRCDEIGGRLLQMGVWSFPLDAAQIKKLLYEIYHPGLSQIHRNPNLDDDGFAGFPAAGPVTPRAPFGGAALALPSA